ncbi:hypothetical protein SDC9_86287 [bioreactor metagenome]|uniref:Uncharacterized protein n=1 Tax=bioreactor metagenome TaxID=1076179 RepID=A0A644ZLS5_9ZZZZ
MESLSREYGVSHSDISFYIPAKYKKIFLAKVTYPTYCII